MPLLGGIEFERVAERGQHFVRRPDVAALFQPCVPGRADAGDHRDFLAPKARRAPAQAGRQADIGRIEALAPRAQESAEFALADFVGGGGGQAHARSE